MNHDEEYLKVLNVIAGSFGAEMDDLTLDFWLDLLQEDGISIDQFRAAAKKIIRTRKYKSMPTYAEFIECVSGNIDDKARIQADEVLNQLRIHGAAGNPVFDDPTTKCVMESIFPWQAWASGLLEKNIPFFKRDFIEAYKTYSGAAERKQLEQVEYSPKLKQLTAGIG